MTTLICTTGLLWYHIIRLYEKYKNIQHNYIKSYFKLLMIFIKMGYFKSENIWGVWTITFTFWLQITTNLFIVRSFYSIKYHYSQMDGIRTRKLLHPKQASYQLDFHLYKLLLNTMLSHNSENKNIQYLIDTLRLFYLSIPIIPIFTYLSENKKVERLNITGYIIISIIILFIIIYLTHIVTIKTLNTEWQLKILNDYLIIIEWQ